MRTLVHKPSPAMIVACVALFAGTSGVGYAASTVGSSQIKHNAVLSKHIKNGQVKQQDLRNGAVNSAKVADGSLTGADLAKETITGDRVKDGDLTGSDLADNSVSGPKVVDNSLTGKDLDESTLGQVPDAATVGGKAPSAFIASNIYKRESAVVAGTDLGDGTYTIETSCDSGDVMLSGGPANVAATSTMVESFPAPGTTNGWKARINKNGYTDNFSVVLLCANQ